MSEQKFWISIWSLAAAVVVVFIVTCGINIHHNTTRIAEMVENGADPIIASCALDGGLVNADVICASLGDER